jgi:ABC-2 type transport system permease protein
VTPFASIIRVTIRQLSGRIRVIGFGLLSLLPAVLLFAASRAREAEGIDTDLGGLLVDPFFTIVLPLTTLILAGSALRDERRDMTLSFLVLRPIGRFQIAMAKTVAATAASGAYALLGATALCVTYVAVGGHINVLPSIAAGALLVCALYSALFVLLGNVTSRPTLVGLLYLLIIENGLVQELPRLSPLSPWRVGLAATIDLMPQGFPARAILAPIGNLDPSALAALGATTATVIVAVGFLTILLKRFDSV